MHNTTFRLMQQHIANGVLLILGFLAFWGSGMDLAGAIVRFKEGEYLLTVLDVALAIWLFAMGIRNVKVTLVYYRKRFKF